MAKRNQTTKERETAPQTETETAPQTETTETAPAVDQVGEQSPAAESGDAPAAESGDGTGVVDATPPAVEQAAPPEPVTVSMDVMLRDLPTVEAVGYQQLAPSPRLTGEQAELQARIYETLRRKGLELQDQGAVYPWLLDQVAAFISRS